MCGIFGVISTAAVSPADVQALAKHAQQRGRDSSGLYFQDPRSATVHRWDGTIISLLRRQPYRGLNVVLGHSRLITNGLEDNQPVVRDGICVFHNGIVVNHASLWDQIGDKPRQQIDTEVIAAIANQHLKHGGSVEGVPERVLELCEGVALSAFFPTPCRLLLSTHRVSATIVGTIGRAMCHDQGRNYFSLLKAIVVRLALNA